MDQNQQDPQSDINIEDLQKQIAATLGITDLSDQKQKEIIEKATEVLLQKIFLDTIDKLSEEDTITYDELLEKKTDPAEIEKFLDDKIPNRTDIILETIDTFINNMKTAASTPIDTKA